VTSPGLFRVDVLPSQVTRVLAASYRGTAEVVGEDGSVLLRSGQKTDVYAGEAPKRAVSFNSYQMDDFDRWNEERATYYARATTDQRESGAYAAQRPAAGQDYEYRDYDEDVDYEQIPDEVRPYYGELSSQGRWTFIPEFGPVWYPLGVGTGWRPYYSGEWMYGPYGWNWTSYEPWGWAPYHYGRWHWTMGFGWIWAPGSVFSGAWCSWYYGPSYIGWCPLDYYDRPAFMNISFYLGGWGCDPYCWNFLPYGGFHHEHHDGDHHDHDHHHGEDIKRVAVPEMKQGVIVKRPVSGRSGYISGGSADRAGLLEQARKRANWESTQSREAQPARGAGGSVEKKSYRSFRDQERPAIERIRKGEFRKPDIQSKGGEAVSPGGRYERKTPGAARTVTPGSYSRDDRGIAGKGTAPQKGTVPQKGTAPQVDRKTPKTFPRKEGSAPPAQRQSYAPKGRQAQARGSDGAGSSRSFATEERLQSRDSRTPERARPQGSPRYGSVQGSTQGSPSSAERSRTPSDERLRRLFRDVDRPSSAPQSGGPQVKGQSSARRETPQQPAYRAQPRSGAQPRPEARAPRSSPQPRPEARAPRSGSQPRGEVRSQGRSQSRSGSGSGSKQQHSQKSK